MRASTNRNSPSGTPHLLPSPPPTPPHTPLLLHQSLPPPLHAQPPRAPQLRRCTAAPRSVARYRSCGCAHCGCRSARRARKRLGHWQARAFYSRSMRRSGGRVPHHTRRGPQTRGGVHTRTLALVRTCAHVHERALPVSALSLRSHTAGSRVRARGLPRAASRKCRGGPVPHLPSACAVVLCSPHLSTRFAAHTTQPVLQPTPLNLRWAVCAATARNLRRRSRY